MTQTHRFRTSMKILLAALLLCPAALAAVENDTAGSRDYPLFERYPGSVITGYAQTIKTTYQLPAGPLKDGKPARTMPVSGLLTRITYHAPLNAQPDEVFRYYEGQFTAAGFTTVFSASGEELSKFTDWADAFYGDIYSAAGETKNQHFIAARRPGSPELYAALYVTQGWYAYPVVQLDVVETRGEKQKKAGKARSAFLRRIERSSCVEVPALQFDGATNELLPSSEKALKDIAEAVAALPRRHFFVVSHSDNAGGYAAGMARSQARADTVVKALVSRYNVPPDRVTAKGVGPLCPARDISYAAGRRANARIEIVTP